MRSGMTRHQANRHPVATAVIFIVLGPFLLAGAFAVGVAYVLAMLLSGVVFLASGRWQ